MKSILSVLIALSICSCTLNVKTSGSHDSKENELDAHLIRTNEFNKRFSDYLDADSIIFNVVNDTLRARVVNSRKIATSRQRSGTEWKGAGAIASVAATLAEQELKRRNLHFISILADGELSQFSTQTLADVEISSKVLRTFLYHMRSKDFDAGVQMFDQSVLDQTAKKELMQQLPQMFPGKYTGEPELRGFESTAGRITMLVNLHYQQATKSFGFVIDPIAETILGLTMF